MKSLFNRRNRAPVVPAARAAEATRERVAAVERLIQDQFVMDLGKLLAGATPDFPYVHPSLGSRLQEALEPFLSTGERFRPDFGQSGALDIADALGLDDEPFVAVVEFQDQSVRLAPDDEPIPSRRRRIRIRFVIAADAQSILWAEIVPQDPPSPPR